MSCTLDTLTLADVPNFMVVAGDICTICTATGARLKVSTFVQVGRNMHLAAEYRACPACESLLIDAAHNAVANNTRHLVRTLTLHGHRDHYAGRGQKGKLDPSGVVIAKRVICDTSEAAA